MAAGANLSDCKPGFPRRQPVGDFDVLYARGRWAVPDLTLEPLERLPLAFGGNLHAAVGQITDKAVQAFARGRRLREKPIANAMDPAADQVQSRGDHCKEESIIARAEEAPASFEQQDQSCQLSNVIAVRGTLTSTSLVSWLVPAYTVAV